MNTKDALHRFDKALAEIEELGAVTGLHTNYAFALRQVVSIAQAARRAEVFPLSARFVIDHIDENKPNADGSVTVTLTPETVRMLKEVQNYATINNPLTGLLRTTMGKALSNLRMKQDPEAHETADRLENTFKELIEGKLDIEYSKLVEKLAKAAHESTVVRGGLPNLIKHPDAWEKSSNHPPYPEEFMRMWSKSDDKGGES